MYVCLCKGLTESDIRRACAGSGSTDPHALLESLGLDDEECCGRCPDRIDELVALGTCGRMCDFLKPA
jgi:bacterioferritin-associated ferredoxin